MTADTLRAQIVVGEATPLYRCGLVAELAEHDVLPAGNAAEVLEAMSRGPDLVFVDLRIADDTVIAAARAAEIPVVLSVSRDADGVLDLVRGGVSGLWDREGDVGELHRIVSGALAGAPVLSPEVGAALLGRIAATGADSATLTGREREILELMADGEGNRAIADRLFISENTVRNHVRNVLDKLHARTRTEAVVRAVRSGLIRLG
ncbi:MAG: response regulator transcription factor [Candidatus Nanopelagicales bacterium]